MHLPRVSCANFLGRLPRNLCRKLALWSCGYVRPAGLLLASPEAISLARVTRCVKLAA